ncbi:8-amino-7-oxononanoate synthase [Aquimarina sp. ERC-38]|uniref:aminotransferase class I/II-fold pyridoxal phosphate-dependent enzyme n=1 Tax=Aquimarina sp. ERC-38 TaxID=2949996 RepID=UPI0022458BD8|nr:8-amino-7-oxononanoate synthase [Aquimarina sp. ERC-38]UZO81627.1 8-amino-7-oxononanoate synthase [Aquimarina sp. ERC-38]
MEFPKKLQKKLEDRKQANAFRSLKASSGLIDFSSNDYLGFSKDAIIYQNAEILLKQQNLQENGSTGSRLLSGNHTLYQTTEKEITHFHQAEEALIFNSGYDANLGFFSAVPQRGDFIFYDELIHASIRDGIRMSSAKAFKFQHNDLDSLQDKIKNLAINQSTSEIYVVTESVFSMDGDVPDLKELTTLGVNNNYHLIIDEAHATGVFGKYGEGLVQHLHLQEAVFARIHTFGKALGCHGAVILGSDLLKQYLINYARSFIYTTALPPHAVATIQASYVALKNTKVIQNLKENIQYFRDEIIKNGLEPHFIKSTSAIHCCLIPGNDKVKEIATFLAQKGFDVKPILSPTVKEGEERLRFCLHSYNSSVDISEVLSILATFVI